MSWSLPHLFIRSLCQYPDVLASTAPLRRHDIGGSVVCGDPCEAAWHDLVSVRAPDGVHAYGNGLCRESQRTVRPPDRRLRECHVLLCDVGVRSGLQPLDQLPAGFARERAAKYRLEALVGPRRLDDELIEVIQYVIQCRTLATPPGRQRRQLQRLAQQPGGNLR